MDYSEKIKTLAKFKLMAKQQLKKNVDLEKLSSNQEYARLVLRELENAAEDEEMLLMVLHMRELLLPATAPIVPPAASSAIPEKTEEEKADAKGNKNYAFGARSW
ncbi:MAG: hypothetical protein ACRERR_03480 [Moraxellaceae bacterium]